MALKTSKEVGMHTRILSIDPGGNTTGIAITDLDESTGKSYVLDAFTLHLDKLIKQRYNGFIAVYGERFTRLIALKEAVAEIYQKYQPHVVVSEGPYMGSFVTTFASLTSCVVAIRFAIADISNSTDVIVIDPATVKKSIGVSGKSGDKERMRVALSTRPIIFVEVVFNELDEHSVDAIAVGQSYYELYIKEKT